MTDSNPMNASGYWYPDETHATTVDVLTTLRRYRAAEVAMRARTRASMGMNETDLLALRYLLSEQRAGHTVQNRDLAKALKISTASVTAMLDRLERGGHVTREKHPSDRRAHIIVPTAESEREVRETLGAMHTRMLKMVEELSDDERTTVTRFLAGMAAAVEEGRVGAQSATAGEEGAGDEPSGA
jgi:DNA-binding MarR family transcriptional regulator